MLNNLFKSKQTDLWKKYLETPKDEKQYLI